jgi:hypothetical protein
MIPPEFPEGEKKALVWGSLLVVGLFFFWLVAPLLIYIVVKLTRLFT